MDEALERILRESSAPLNSVAAAPETLTDSGNARRLVRLHGQDLHYCATLGWLVYDGTRWAKDRTDEVCRRAKATARALYGEAESALDKDQRVALANHAKKMEGEPRIRAMISLAQSEIPIAITEDKFDVEVFALNTPNGTLDLRTGTLRPHRRDDLLTKCTNVPYEAAAQAPRFHAFLERIFHENQNLIRFVQRALGYSLTGDTSEQAFFVPWGTGANGKSTLSEVIAWCLGDYAGCASADTFLMKRSGTIPNDMAALRGMRYVYATEIDGNKRLSESTVKRVTGGDMVSARFMFREFFSFQPSFKLWIATNHLPQITGTDHAIWRRVHLVPFTVQIPPDERDKHLKDTLKEEGPGILAWAVAGCRDWLEHGLGVPDEVTVATAEYKRDMDVLGPFFEQVCIHDQETSVGASALYESYCTWCRSAGETPVTQRALSMALKERGYQSKHTKSGSRWQGLRLRDLAEADASSTPYDQVDLRAL